MKVLKIIVDELPKSCGECDFLCDRYYCQAKLASGQQSFVDRSSETIQTDCPLTIEPNK